MDPMTEDADDLIPGEKGPLEVQVQVADGGLWTKRLNMTVPAAEVGKAFDSILKEVVGGLRLPGFRPGKVPKGYAEKLLGDDLRRRVLLNVTTRAIHSALEKEKLDVVGEPKMGQEELKVERGKDFSFAVEMEIKPTFELGNYKGLPLEQEEVDVKPEEVTEQLKRLAERFAKPAEWPADGAVRERDSALGVLRVLAEGQEIHKEEEAGLLMADGHTFGAPAHLGSAFLEGAKLGEVRTAEVTLDDHFPVETWRGKKATLEFTMARGQRLELPPQDDELAKQAGAKDLEDLKQKIGDELREHLTGEVREKVKQELLERLAGAHPFELPKRLKESFSKQLAEGGLRYLSNYGLDPSLLDEHRTKLDQTASLSAEKKLREFFLLDAIAKKEGLTLSEEELDEELVKAARKRGMRAAELLQQLEENGKLDEYERELEARKTVDFLLEHAEIKVVPRKWEAKPAHACDHESHQHQEHP